MSEATSGTGLDATLRDFSGGQKVFNRYTLMRTLGRGGMGIVWLAHDEVLDRDVALKFLPEIIIQDRAVLEDLKRETKRSLELTHKNIVRIHDFVHDVVSACISMEYIEGDTLSNLRADKPAKVFERDEVKPWLSQLCDALDYAHNHARIIHRDLKPSNLMISKRGHLKVADFGIARSLSDSVSMLTHARGTSGTLVYMSPQQLDGERGTHLDDIYSLGATVYELLTSKPPFYSGNIDRQIREKIAPSMTQRRKELEIEGNPIPKNWEQTVAACLAKDPARRPQSVAAIAVPLELSSPVARGTQAKTPTTKMFVIAAALICSAVFVFIFLRHPTTQKITESTRSPAPVPSITASPALTSPPVSELLAPDRLLKEATASRDRGDYQASAKLFQEAADQGSARAQVNLARLYEEGNGLPKNSGKAIELYQKAAEQGDAEAELTLGFKYELGQGVPRDLGKALEWYKKAAEQGYAYAQRQLGSVYEDGRGTPRDVAKAVEWYTRAVDQGDAVAENKLGMLYENGIGVAKDLDKALELYRKASAQGDIGGNRNLRRLEQSEPVAPGTKNIPQGSSLGITDVMASESPDPNVDTNLTLRISVTKRQNTMIDHTKVKIQVFFYDTVGDKDIKLTNADVSYEWLTPNHDWNRDTESLAVTYTGPNNKGPDSKAGQAGHRKYLGYIVRLYYKDQLQDKRADPAKLLNLFPAPFTAPPQ